MKTIGVGSVMFALVVLVAGVLFCGVGCVIDTLSLAQRLYNEQWGKWIESTIWLIGLPSGLISYVYHRLKYSGVSMIVIKGGEAVGKMGISVQKARLMANDEWDRQLTLKGFSSTFGWLNCPVLEISHYDADAKQWVIDMDKNPVSKPKGPSKELVLLEEIKAKLAEGVGLHQGEKAAPSNPSNSRKASKKGKKRR